MRLGVWISGVLLCATTSTGFAQDRVPQDMFQLRNTGDLVALCSAAPSDPLYTAAVNFCHGFALGVFKVLQQEGAASRAGQIFCMPDPPPTRQEGITDFISWGHSNPGQ